MAEEETFKKVNINSATAQEIAYVCPMLGREKSEAIVRRRAMHGPYSSLDELRAIPGFADKLTKGLEDFFTLGRAHTSKQVEA